MIKSTAQRVARVLRLIDRIDEEAARKLEEEEDRAHERRLRDPFLFDSWESWARYRRRHGYRTPRRRARPDERNIERQPWAILARWDR